MLTNDTDAENDPLTVSNPGTYVGTYGTLTWTPTAATPTRPTPPRTGSPRARSAQDVFSYTATDGSAIGHGDPHRHRQRHQRRADDRRGRHRRRRLGHRAARRRSGRRHITIHTDSGTVAFDDVDLTDTHSASFTPQGGGYLGTFTLDPVDQTGDSVGWDFTVSDAALEGLSEGEIRIQTYTVEIDDGNGGTVTQDVTITITGAGVGAGPQTVWYIDNSAVGSANVGTSGRSLSPRSPRSTRRRARWAGRRPAIPSICSRAPAPASMPRRTASTCSTARS